MNPLPHPPTHWPGLALHLTETCDHDVRPLIIHVDTPPASPESSFPRASALALIRTMGYASIKIGLGTQVQSVPL